MLWRLAAPYLTQTCQRLQVGESPGLRRFTSMEPKPAEFPEMTCKAADVPIVVRWLAHVAEGEPHLWDQMICSACWSAGRFFTIIAKANVFMEAAVACEAALHLNTFVCCMSFLARAATDQGQLLFRLRPKFHLLLHVHANLCGGSSSYVWNPMVDTTWQDESFVGRMARIARRVHPSTANTRTLERYLLMLRSRMSRPLEKRGVV